MKYDLSFSLNLHDEEGDIYEECILIHLGNGTIIQFSNLKEYDNFIEQLQYLRTEINDNIN